MKYNILWFDIPVYDSQRMYLINSITDLFHKKSNLLFRDSLRLFQIMIQLPTSTDLKNDINVSVVIKVAIHFYDVWMVEIHLDFQLPNKLLGYLFLK